MVLVEKCFGAGGFSRHSPGSNLEPPNASWSFLAKSGAARAPLADVAHLKPKSAYGITGRKNEANYQVAIPAVPLRSVPTIDVQGEIKESESSHDKDHEEGQKQTKTLDTFHQEEELWEHELKKLTAVIDDAKEFISLMDVKYPTPKRVRGSESVMLQDLDGSVSGKRLKDNSGISVAAQGGKSSGTETISQDEDEDEVSLLSHAEWIASQQLLNHKKDECVEPSIGKLAKNIERQSSLKIARECKMDPISVGTKTDKPGGKSSSRELTETECRDIHWHGSSDSDDELEMFDDEATSTYSAMINDQELINLEIVKHDHPQGRKVMEALKLFEKEYLKLKKEYELNPREGNITKRPHLDSAAARIVEKKGMRIFTDKPFGHVPGVEIGDEFSYRAELTTVGLSHQPMKGIDSVSLNGKRYATSVVNSWRYENTAKEGDVLIYYGEGGNPNTCAKGAPADQKLKRGNLALYNSMEMGYPVRVIHKRKCLTESKKLHVNEKHDYLYVYDGLYKVNRYWHERETGSDGIGKLVYKFELQRLPGQPKINGTHIEFRKQIHSSEDCDVLQGKLITKSGLEKDIQPLLEKETFEVANGVQGPPRNHGTDVKRGKQIQATDVCVLDDVSNGKEKFKVRAVNGVDDDLPPTFTYITKIFYPYGEWLTEPIGCDCINGCSDSVRCPCVVKNGSEIPYTEKGKLMRAKPNKIVHECGPSCKCPPSCMNRVSQHSPCLLEIFKTKTMGWGVRSPDYINPGTFICEYVGELLREEEADQRIGNDQYLFDICHGESKQDDVTLDAAKFGNIGRFINHSCDPNVFAQEVLYDHDEKRMPHIMFFASKCIPPRKELMYDYNYTKIRVRDANGNIKRKACHCGSRKCTGRLY